MAPEKLQLHHSRRAVMAALLLGAVSACETLDKPVGMTLLFMNKGRDYLVVQRFDPDGRRGPVPGALGAGGGGAQMSFMPGDSDRAVPQFVEVEWTIPNNEYLAWSKEMDKLPSQARYSKENRETYTTLWSANPRYSQRIDLTAILTPALIAQARSNPKTTNVKLVVTFKDDQVSIEAMPEKWR